MIRIVAEVENEISEIKKKYPNWIDNLEILNVIAVLTNEKLSIINSAITERPMTNAKSSSNILQFSKILKDNGIRPDVYTITKIQKAGVLTTAVYMGAETVIDTYQSYRELLSTNTCQIIEERLRIHINAPSYVDSKSLLLTAVGEDGILKIVKILRFKSHSNNMNIQVVNDKIFEFEMEKTACDVLNLSRSHDGLITATVISINIPQHTESKGGDIVAIIMPMYPGTVGKAPRFYGHTIYRQGNRLLSALKFIHSHGIIHMDVKSDNVFIDIDGNWILGDFGSCKYINHTITSTTNIFYYRKLVKEPALPKYDYYMLLVMLLIETLEDKHSFRVKFIKNDLNVDYDIITSYANEIIQTHEIGPIITELMTLIV